MFKSNKTGHKIMFRESKIQNTTEEMVVITPGVLHAPQWFDHGSLFVFDKQN